MARRGACGAASALTLLVFAAPADRVEAREEVCAKNLPTGWQVLHVDPSNEHNDPSSTSMGMTLVCNYRVNHEVQLAGGGGTKSFLNGAGITIEYYCSADEATEAFDGKTGFRDTETQRSETHVVSEEGPLAANPDNPQSDGVFSVFFPDGNFNLMEKEWVLLNSQVVATIVVLTGERGAVEEELRFGVDDAELVARAVANGNKAGADCAIPAIDTSTTTGKSSPAGPLILIGIGTIAVITGGRVITKKRKKPKGHRPPALEGVPPECAGAARRYVQSRNRYLDLKEALEELSEQLRVAETRHANNIMKIKLIGAWELASIAGGAIGDAASAGLRPRGGGPPMTRDNWAPPSKGGGLTGKMASALAAAKEALDAALAKARRWVGELEALREMRRNIDDHPYVQQFRRVRDNALEQVERARTQLAKAKEIDAAIDHVEGEIRRVEAARKPLAERRFRLDTEIHRLDDEIWKKEQALEKNLDRYRDDIESRRRAINLDATFDSSNPMPLPGTPEFTRVYGNDPRLRSLVEEMHYTRTQDMMDIEAMKTSLGELRREAGELDTNLRELTKGVERNIAEHDRLLQEYRKYGDMTDEGVTNLERHFAEADHDFNMAHGKVAGEVEANIAKAQKQLEAADLEAQIAQTYYDNLLKMSGGADAAGTTAAATVPSAARTWTVGNVLSTPFRLIGRAVEWAIGTGQSPEEMWKILVFGKQHVEELKLMVTHIERAMNAELKTAISRREVYERCRMTRTGTPAAPLQMDRPLSPPVPGGSG